MSINIPDTRPPAINHVFVDFENVSSIDFSIISTKPVSITVFIGAHQSRLLPKGGGQFLLPITDHSALLSSTEN